MITIVMTIELVRFDESAASLVHDGFIRKESYEQQGTTFNRYSVKGGFTLRKKPYKNGIEAARKLQSFSGVERLVQEGQNFYITNHPTGTPLNQAKLIPQDYFDELKKLVGSIHGIGVAGLNYRNPNSILIDANGSPIITNFSNSTVRNVFPTQSDYGIMSELVEILKSAILGNNYKSDRPISRLDFKVASRLSYHWSRLGAERKRKAFEEAKRLDLGYVLYLKNRFTGKHLKPEEVIEFDRFILAHRRSS